MGRIMITVSDFVSSLCSGGSQSIVHDPHKVWSGDPQKYVFPLEVKGTALNVVNVLSVQ